MGSYLTDENESETPDLPEVLQALQTPQGGAFPYRVRQAQIRRSAFPQVILSLVKIDKPVLSVTAENRSQLFLAAF